MLGSRDSAAAPNIVLNTIVAEALGEACDVLEQAEDFEQAVHDLIKLMQQSIRKLYSMETAIR